MTNTKSRGKANSAKKGSFYVRSVVSNLTLILIPIILIIVLYASRYTEKYKEEVYETVQMALEHFADQSESQFRNLGNIVVMASLDGSLDAAIAPKSMLDYRQAMRAINLISTANPYISEIILLPSRGDYAVTTTSTISKKSLYGRGLAIENHDRNEIKEHLEAGTAYIFPFSDVHIFSNSYYNGRSLILVYPITKGSQVKGTFSFIITENTMKKMIGRKLLSHDSDIIIIDNSTGNLLFTTRTEEDSLPPKQFDCHPSVVRGKDGKSYMATYVDSPGGYRTYISLISEDHHYEQIESLRTEFLISLLFVMLFSLLVGYLLHRFNYRSIRGLDDKARKIIPKGDRTDIENVANALDVLSSKNTELTEKIISNREAVINDRLNQLLSGYYQNAAEFNRSCRELGLRMKSETSAVAVMVFDGEYKLRTILNLLREHLSFCTFFFLQRTMIRQIILILNAGEDDEERIVRSLESCLEELTRNKIETTVALSSFHYATNELSNAYMETLNALDYRFIKGLGRIIRKTDIPERDIMEYEYPKKNLEALDLAIRTKDIHKVRESIKTLFAFMEENRLPVFICRSIAFDIVKILRHQKIRETKIFNELEKKNTLAEIEDNINRWLDGMKDIEKRQMEEKSIKSILAYIDENLFDCNFSVSSCAEHFGMNLPALSKYFKEKIGKTVIDYVIEKRSAKAQELLKNTDKPLKVIAEEVGYANLTSFNRRFKLSTGMTPSEYRKTSRGK